MRRAESSPFHTLDSHIKNHSPPIVMNPSAQSSNPSQRPAMGSVFATANSCLERSAENRRFAPSPQMQPVMSSHRMIVQYATWCS